MSEAVMNNENENLIPKDIEAEKATLGSMLKNQNAVADVIDVLKAEDFYLKEHQEIFKVMYNMFAKNIAIDIMTVHAELSSLKMIEMIGGLTYLTELSEFAIVPSNAKFYAEIVVDKSKMRQLIVQADRIKALAVSNELPPEDILDAAEQRIMEIAQKTQKKDYESIDAVLIENIKNIQDLEKNKNKLAGVETGFKRIDAILGGLHKTDLIILAARPGVGKTAFALNVAQHASLIGKKVMVFNLEMGNSQLGERFLAMTSSVPMENIRNGKLTAEEWESISNAQDSFEKVDLVLDDSSSPTPVEIKNKCRRFKAERGGLDLVIIDYLQLMSVGGYRIEQREKELGSITRAIKIMAKELDCAVVLLSQLNREVEKRSGHRTQLSDLRDSGSIEQDADIVIFLQRQDLLDGGSDDMPAETDTNTALTCQVHIAKHRNGTTGIVDLVWIPKYTKFGNLALESE